MVHTVLPCGAVAPPNGSGTARPEKISGERGRCPHHKPLRRLAGRHVNLPWESAGAFTINQNPRLRSPKPCKTLWNTCSWLPLFYRLEPREPRTIHGTISLDTPIDGRYRTNEVGSI